jgi:hypothetical protein
VVPLREGSTYWSVLSSLIASAKVTGQLVHDARIVALCLSQGIKDPLERGSGLQQIPAG